MNKRNKKILALAAALLMASALAGCGGSGEQETSLKDLEVERYVTLGEYKGLEVSVPPVTVDEELWKQEADGAYFDAVMSSQAEIADPILDRAVADGDIVNIDYVGKLDGEAFAGGTAQGANLPIGSGSYIEGFEAGLVGVMPGETVDLDLTFPENYQSAELAGQKVVFTVKVNCIVPEEMEEVFIREMQIDGVEDREGLRQYVYDYLYSYAEQNRAGAVDTAVQDALLQRCTFAEKLPNFLYDKVEDVLRSNVEQDAAYYGVDAESYLQQVYGGSMVEFLEEYVPKSVKSQLAFQAVANREDLNLSDEALEERLLGYAVNSGYETVEEWLGDRSREDYREAFMYSSVLDFLEENARITEQQ